MGATAKRLDVSILLDSERHEALKSYAKAKNTNLDDAATLVVNTGLSRIAALRKHASANSNGEKKPRAAKPKAEAKPKVKAAAKPKKSGKKAKPAKAAKKAEAKPATASKAVKRVAKANTPVKVQKSGASVSRIAPQKPGPAAAPPINSTPAVNTAEVAEA